MDVTMIEQLVADNVAGGVAIYLYDTSLMLPYLAVAAGELAADLLNLKGTMQYAGIAVGGVLAYFAAKQRVGDAAVVVGAALVSKLAGDSVLGFIKGWESKSQSTPYAASKYEYQ